MSTVHRPYATAVAALAASAAIALTGVALTHSGSARACVADPATQTCVLPQSPNSSPSPGGVQGGVGSPSPSPVAYPQISDPSGYTFTARDFQLVGLTPQQITDMQSKSVPLGVTSAQWTQLTNELSQALTDAGIPDADVRLKGSSMRFFSYDTKTKGFPQTVDELTTRVKAYNAVSPDVDAIAAQSAQTYKAAGYGTAPQPMHSFFNALNTLRCGDPSDYDIQLVSQTLAGKFDEYIRQHPNEPVLGDDQYTAELDPTISDKGGHYKWRYLQYVAPALWRWSQNWTGILGADVAVSTFSPATAPTLRDSDWVILKSA